MMREDVIKAIRRDRHAFERVVQHTSPLVAAIALAITRDRDAARDVAQDAYLAAWLAMPRLRNPDSFLPWLRQIARAIAHSAVRARLARRKREVDEAAIDTMVLEQIADWRELPDARVEQAERHAAVIAALDELPDETRECVLLFYSESQSADQVAALLGLSAAAVRKRLERARQTLRREVARRLGEQAHDVRTSIPVTVMTMLGTAPRDSSAAAIAAAQIASPSVLAAGPAALGFALTCRRIGQLANRLATDRRRFLVAAMAMSLALGVVLPLWRPRLVWLWFSAYQAAVAVALFWWLPARGVTVRRRDVVRWLISAAAGAGAVLWAVSKMGA